MYPHAPNSHPLQTVRFNLIMRYLIIFLLFFVQPALPQHVHVGGLQQGTADPHHWLSKDERIVALTLLGEARGEKSAGLYAVACVVRQRMIERKLTARQVCLQKGKRICQFSFWNGKSFKKAEVRQSPPSTLDRLLDTNSLYASYLAIHLCSGRDFQRKYVGFANHYCSLKTNPYWAFKKVKKNGKEIKVAIKPVKIIGNHKFFRLK